MSKLNQILTRSLSTLLNKDAEIAILRGHLAEAKKIHANDIKRLESNREIVDEERARRIDAQDEAANLRTSAELLQTENRRLNEKLASVIADNGCISRHNEDLQRFNESITINRDYFCASINRIAKMVGMPGDVAAPEAVERHVAELVEYKRKDQAQLTQIIPAIPAEQRMKPDAAKVMPWDFDSSPEHPMKAKRKDGSERGVLTFYPSYASFETGIGYGHKQVTLSYRKLAEELELLDGSPCGIAQKESGWPKWGKSAFGNYYKAESEKGDCYCYTERRPIPAHLIPRSIAETWTQLCELYQLTPIPASEALAIIQATPVEMGEE